MNYPETEDFWASNSLTTVLSTLALYCVSNRERPISRRLTFLGVPS